MLKLEIEGQVVHFYTDVLEYVHTFFVIPDNVVVDTNDIPESAGFASIDDNEIYIFASNNCSFSDLLSTVAHELGHLVEGGFKKNPPQKQRHYKTHEKKACHYEDFVVKSFRITNELMKHIKN
jgi:Zn-dependent peptidase ImmA (M78 family)